MKWSSTKKSVATVNKKGVVTAKKKGTAYIKAKVGKKTYKGKKVKISGKKFKVSLKAKLKKKQKFASRSKILTISDSASERSTKTA